MEEEKGLWFKRIVAWSVVLCLLALVVVMYVHISLSARQLEREIIYRKASTLAAQQQRERIVNYQKRFEQQRLRQEYNRGKVVGVKNSSAR